MQNRIRGIVALVAAAWLMLGAAQAQEVRWQVSLWGKPRAFTAHLEQLAKLVERRTRGAFKLELVYGGLAPPRENLDAIAAGQFEMAQFCAGYHPEKNWAITVLELPFGPSSLDEEIALSQVVYGHPSVIEEMARFNARLLMPSPLPQYNLVGRGVPPQDASWFPGKRIRATGGIAALLRRLGAEPVSLTAPETRDAFASGAIDAVAFAPHAHFSFDTISMADWWTRNLNPGTVHCPVVVNIDALEALPAEYRDVLLQSVGPALDYYLQNYADLENKWSEVLDVFGVAIVELAPDVTRLLERDALPEIMAEWVARSTSLGLPGQTLLGLVRPRAINN